MLHNVSAYIVREGGFTPRIHFDRWNIPGYFLKE